MPDAFPRVHQQLRPLGTTTIRSPAMHSIVVAVALSPLLIAGYAYLGYPAILWLVASSRRATGEFRAVAEWPLITLTVPVYNAAATISATIERLLLVAYPRDRVQILVISDGSTDGTDDVVRGYASQGVELHRMPQRRGKTAAENAAIAFARGEIVVNVDATVLVPADALKPLIAAFTDPTVGVASGRDISVGDLEGESTSAESAYVGYEMWVRDLETRVGSIVGASGCFYAIRRAVHATPLPSHLSWDFASALVARELGYRSVSVPSATCLVPRTAKIRTESRRKVRTMARGLRTLFYKRALMNPRRYGAFSLMLISHKLLRWLPYLLVPVALGALMLLATEDLRARMILGVLVGGGIAGAIGTRLRHRSGLFAPFALAGFAAAVVNAGFLAWVEAVRRTPMATWEPTPRPGGPSPVQSGA